LISFLQNEDKGFKEMLTISFLIFYCFEQTSNQINKKSNDNDFVSMNLPYIIKIENIKTMINKKHSTIRMLFINF